VASLIFAFSPACGSSPRGKQNMTGAHQRAVEHVVMLVEQLSQRLFGRLGFGEFVPAKLRPRSCPGDPSPSASKSFKTFSKGRSFFLDFFLDRGHFLAVDFFFCSNNDGNFAK